MTARNWKVRSVLICDDIRTETTGKEILIGVYRGAVVVPTAPISLPSLALRIEFGVTGVSEREDFETSIRFLSPDKVEIFFASGMIDIIEPLEPAVISLTFGPATFPKQGEYKIMMTLFGQTKTISTLKLRIGSPPINADVPSRLNHPSS